MIYGYIRVSTKDQHLHRQVDSLLPYVGDKNNIYSDKKSGKNLDRKAYQELKSIVVKGDELYIHELHRLGRNKKELKQEFEWFREHGVILRILNMPTTLIELDGQEWIVEMINNIILEVLASIAEQERHDLLVRQAEGIESAKKRGVRFGRKNIDNDKISSVRELIEKGHSVSNACLEVGIARKTWYNYNEAHS